MKKNFNTPPCPQPTTKLFVLLKNFLSDLLQQRSRLVWNPCLDTDMGKLLSYLTTLGPKKKKKESSAFSGAIWENEGLMQFQN